MSEKDGEALALLIKYCEEEAARLGLPAVVIQCMRMASEELTTTWAIRLPMVTIDDPCTRH
jgi:hypothetical protein